MKVAALIIIALGYSACVWASAELDQVLTEQSIARGRFYREAASQARILPQEALQLREKHMGPSAAKLNKMIGKEFDRGLAEIGPKVKALKNPKGAEIAGPGRDSRTAGQNSVAPTTGGSATSRGTGRREYILDGSNVPKELEFGGSQPQKK